MLCAGGFVHAGGFARCSSLAVLVLALTGCQAAARAQSASPAPAFDPVAMDAARGDPPAESPDLQFTSAGAHLNAYAHIAAGAGPHPTVVLLHGFPGNERSLDIAQALRRAGWNAFFFTYRGTWGSGGEFSFGHALEDVAAVVATLREPAFAQKYRVDPARIVLLGHSMGGAAALISAAELEAVGCVGAMAGANLGALADRVRESPEAAAASTETFQRWGEGRVRGVTGQDLLADLLAQPDRWRTEAHAAALARKPVLLIAGSRDEVTPPAAHHAPLVAAIEQHGGALLTARVLDDEHQFSSTRVALTREVLAWLATSCAPHLGPR
jgi:pimeloyl-ACP methyl ester carboxylesterase